MFIPRYFCGFLFLFFFCILFAPPSHAATFTVTKTADTNDGSCNVDCSLREAVAAANSNTGFDTIEFNIPTSDGGYIPPSGSTQGYFTINTTSTINLNDIAGVFINGYSQSGAERNTAEFGKTLNTILKIRVSSSSNPVLTFYSVSTSSANNHISGLNIVSTITNGMVIQTTSNGYTSINHWIEGNFFGSDITGMAGSGWGRIEFTEGEGNIIGTNGDGNGDLGEKNLFMGSTNLQMVSIVGKSVIAGNYMGTDKTTRSCSSGSRSRAIIFVQGGSGSRVGTNYDNISDAEEANIVNCVTTDTRALLRLSTATSANYIQGNYVGTNTYGDILSTFAINGISIREGISSNNIIKGNIIANNNGVGIVINNSSPTATNNKISQNKIWNNTNLGIDVLSDGITPNDVLDNDVGTNDFMNYPVLNKIVKDGSNLIVTADLDFNPAEAPFTIELFDNDALDGTGYGEGQYFIGSTTTTTIGNNITFTIPITDYTPTSASKITATATNGNGSTSEFSTIPTDTMLYMTSNIPSLSVQNGTTTSNNGKTRFMGTVHDDNYPISEAQCAINGGGWFVATAIDGSFNSKDEAFYCDFLTTDNNYSEDGYTVKARTRNLNDVWTDNAFYFTPFSLNNPKHNEFTTNELPTFGFKINKGHFQDVKNNVTKFQIQINKNGAGWQTYIDTIPVSYESVKNNADNKHTPAPDTKGNGTYENKKIWVHYSDNNSVINVYSKAVDADGNESNKYMEQNGRRLSAGSYQWRVVAIDKIGHSQITETRILRVNTRQTITGTNTLFPLSVLHITGIGGLNLSTQNPTGIKSSYNTWSTNPTFYGIANANSQVSIELTDKTCEKKAESNCTKRYITTTNPESRFGINLPLQSLIYGRDYTANIFVSLDNNYNELPPFDLKIRNK